MKKLPGVKIAFQNGRLGKVSESPDGLLALLVSAEASGGGFELGHPYELNSMADLPTGINESNNGVLLKHLRDFYAEAGEGVPLVLYGVPKGKTMTELVAKGESDEDAGELRKLITLTGGRLRGVVVALDASDEQEATAGLVPDVLTAIPKAQETAEWATSELYAPLFVLLEGRGLKRQGLTDLSELASNRVAVFVGDTSPESKGAAVGLLAGRIARVGVQRNVGRVADGKIKAEALYLEGKPIEEQSAFVAELYAKGYISPRQHVGRVGYYFTDDRLCTADVDDYSQLTSRRTADKAYRIAYGQLLEFLLDELEVEEDGSLHPARAKQWESAVTSAVDKAMTARGELSADQTSGSGCRFTLKPGNVLASSKVEGVLSVRPLGYARYIDVALGFAVTKQ